MHVMFLAALGGLLCRGSVWAEDTVSLTIAPEPWPEILTLEYALSRIDDSHPQLQLAESAVASALAGRDSVSAGSGVDVSAGGRVRWIEPADIAPNQGHHDHSLALFVSKPLYDFGRSEAFLDAAQAALSGEQHLKHDALNQLRIAVMEAYFNVLLADLTKARNEEAMSGAFIRSDRIKIRNDMGQASDIEVLELQSEYQQVREQWHQSNLLQRTSRGVLANLLDRAANPPNELDAPQLPDNSREVPREIEPWLQKAEADNPVLLALQARIDSARKELEAARAGDRPVLSGELEAATYSREESGHDKFRAGLSISVPLYRGGRLQAETAKRRASLDAALAKLELERLRLRQSLVEAWSKLQTLKISRERAQAEVAYRDLYLDRSRTLYQQEVKSDLGDAMTQTTAARLQQRRVEYELALTWARIDAMLGNAVYAVPAKRVEADAEVDAAAVPEGESEKGE